jgi:hypothetical protein
VEFVFAIFKDSINAQRLVNLVSGGSAISLAQKFARFSP